MFPGKIEEVESHDRKKRWRFTKGTMNSLISFSADDFANLEYLKGLSHDNDRKQKLDELVIKIKALTPPKRARTLETDIEAILESEGFAVRQYSRVKADKKIMELLRNALLSFKKIQFNYTVDESEKLITVNPYGIIIADKYYLVGYNDYVSDLRLYRINKIKNPVILDEYFEKDENFSLTEYCNNSFGIYHETPLDITLEFDATVAEDVLNYHFHPTQKVKKLDNGNIQVKFTSGGTYAICQELFKWGTNVKIKKPANLKTIYQQYLSDVLNNL